MRATIATERLILRPLTLADAAAMHPFLADLAVTRMTGGIPHPHTRIGIEGWILLTQAKAPRGRDFVYAMTLKASDTLIGCIGLHARPSGYELGYWIGPPYWGQGYGSEAAAAVAREGETVGRLPIMANHYVDNPASGRVLEKAGFRYDGGRKDLYSLGRRARAPGLSMVYAPNSDAKPTAA